MALAAVLVSSAASLLSAQQTTPQKAFLQRLVAAAVERTSHHVRYDTSYVRIPYPGGDVPAGTGVCTDEIIRSYRAVGIDLQKEVHEDIVGNWGAYPHDRHWRQAIPIPISITAGFQIWRCFSAVREKRSQLRTAPTITLRAIWLRGTSVEGVPHIGIVVDRKSPQNERYLVVHNIGEGPQMEDVLFRWKITGHYRYFGPAR